MHESENTMESKKLGQVSSRFGSSSQTATPISLPHHMLSRRREGKASKKPNASRPS